MGLFRKKTDDPKQLDALRSEIVSLRERLDAADQQKADLAARVESVDQVNVALNQRVETVDQVNATLNERVNTVDQTNAVLSQRVTALNTTSATLGHQVGALDANTNELATRVGAVDAEVGRVRDGVAAVNDQVGSVAAQVGSVTEQVGSVAAKVESATETGSTVDTLGAQIKALAERLDKTPLAPPAAPDPRLEPLMRQVNTLADTLNAQANTPLVDSDEVRALTARLDEISGELNTQAGRLDEAEQRESERDAAPGVDADDVAAMRSEMSQMAERMATLDHRMTNVSVELANQLTELGSDLDVLLEAAADPDANATDDSAAVALAIEAVQNSTERLAAEQARYQITFREDLAELAERLRRPNS